MKNGRLYIARDPSEKSEEALEIKNQLDWIREAEANDRPQLVRELFPKIQQANLHPDEKSRVMVCLSKLAREYRVDLISTLALQSSISFLEAIHAPENRLDTIFWIAQELLRRNLPLEQRLEIPFNRCVAELGDPKEQSTFAEKFTPIHLPWAKRIAESIRDPHQKARVLLSVVKQL